MFPSFSRREVAAAAALLYAAFSVAMLLFLQEQKISDSAIVIAVLLLPVLIYLVASGDISEIGGPGGFKAKFREVAEARIDAGAEVEDLQLVEKADQAMLEDRTRALRPGVPVALSFRMGAGYNSWMIEQYLDLLLRIDPDVTVAFVDSAGMFRASTDGAKVRSIINNDHFGAALNNAVQADDLAALSDAIKITTRSIANDATNADALKSMLEDGVKSLVAVNSAGRPVGVVRRDDIMARMMAKLAS